MAKKASARRSAAQSVASSSASAQSVGQLKARLRALAGDLQWTWNRDTQRLFAALDPRLWEATNHDPLAVLERMFPERLEALAQDATYLDALGAAEKSLRGYHASMTWFRRTHKGRAARMLVAYFCSEYAIHESMQQYSGGLGVLAGDHLKAASDLGVPLVAVGLLYRCGYYQQEFRTDGAHRVIYPRYDFDRMPVEDTGKRLKLTIGRRDVQMRLWRMKVGRTDLVLLDADVKENTPADRALTAQLYHGPPEHRMKQQILLGVGGYRALQELGYRPTVCHLNEGHAAFVALERMRQLIVSGASYAKAERLVRGSTVFTTHTPVPAGHDRYEPRLIRSYFARMADEIGIDVNALLAFGRERADDAREWFCMTVLALKLAERCNGVAELHGDTSRRMWQGLFDAKRPSAVPIGHVTNGVHTQTWLADEARPLYDKHLKPRWLGAGPDHDPWARAERIPAAELWRMRNLLRARLVGFVRERVLQQIRRGLGSSEELLEAYETFDEDTLTLGFARRFATYKRAPLIFHNATRLARILNHPKRPMQLVFAGKAHPADVPGQAYAQQIYRHAQKAGFRGRVVVLDNYDMHVGQVLTSGADVWLNTPLRPNEASGTSGMKPPLHGGLNCSILDGWWPEAYNGRNGWAIGDTTPRRSQASQDRFDVECLYKLLEGDVARKFYTRGRDGVPRGWVRMMAASMKTVGAAFSAQRMVGDYVKNYYVPAHG